MTGLAGVVFCLSGTNLCTLFMSSQVFTSGNRFGTSSERLFLPWPTALHQPLLQTMLSKTFKVCQKYNAERPPGFGRLLATILSMKHKRLSTKLSAIWQIIDYLGKKKRLSSNGRCYWPWWPLWYCQKSRYHCPSLPCYNVINGNFIQFIPKSHWVFRGRTWKFSSSHRTGERFFSRWIHPSLIMHTVTTALRDPKTTHWRPHMETKWSLHRDPSTPQSRHCTQSCLGPGARHLTRLRPRALLGLRPPNLGRQCLHQHADFLPIKIPAKQSQCVFIFWNYFLFNCYILICTNVKQVHFSRLQQRIWNWTLLSGIPSW